MDMHRTFRFSGRSLGISKALVICSTAVLSFFAGAFLSFYVLHPKPVEASGDRVFQLMIYHTLPGKASALESVFW